VVQIILFIYLFVFDLHFTGVERRGKIISTSSHLLSSPERGENGLIVYRRIWYTLTKCPSTIEIRGKK